MNFFKVATKVLLSVLKFIVLILITLALSFGFGGIVSLIQRTFARDGFIVWTSHDSTMNMINIFEFVFGSLLLAKFYFKEIQKGAISSFFKKHKIKVICGLAASIYFIIVNVSVFYSNKIVNYTFFSPQGKEYSFSDIKSIDAGVYGSRVSYIHSKGEFYYTIKLKDGTKLNLDLSGGVKDSKDMYDAIVEIDKIFVDSGIHKTSDTTHFDLYTKNLKKVYSDKMKRVLDNVK